jgi:hypothetical protein
MNKGATNLRPHSKYKNENINVLQFQKTCSSIFSQVQSTKNRAGYKKILLDTNRKSITLMQPCVENPTKGIQN